MCAITVALRGNWRTTLFWSVQLKKPCPDALGLENKKKLSLETMVRAMFCGDKE